MTEWLMELIMVCSLCANCLLAFFHLKFSEEICRLEQENLHLKKYRDIKPLHLKSLQERIKSYDENKCNCSWDGEKFLICIPCLKRISDKYFK